MGLRPRGGRKVFGLRGLRVRMIGRNRCVFVDWNVVVDMEGKECVDS